MSSLAVSTAGNNIESLERETEFKELPNAADYWQDRHPSWERLQILPSATTYQGFFSVRGPSIRPLQRDLEFLLDFDRPWLPPEAHRLIQKMRKSPLSEKEAVNLMKILAERIIEHYGFEEGECLAISFGGRLIESASSRIDLLRKLQGAPYSENVFVWEVGTEALAGWL